jgi:hypothetical protein
MRRTKRICLYFFLAATFLIPAAISQGLQLTAPRLLATGVAPPPPPPPWPTTSAQVLA